MLAAALPSFAGQQEPQNQTGGSPTLRVGYFQFPPHAYQMPDHQATGSAIELLRDHIAPAMGVNIQFVGPLPLPRLLNDFAQRHLDAVLLLTRTPEREKIFAYPHTPFWEMQPGIVVSKNSMITTLQTPDQLHDLRIAYIRDAWLPEFLMQSNAHMDFTTGESATGLNLQKLVNHRVDAVFGPDKCALTCALIHGKIPDEYHIIDIPSPAPAIYTVFGKNIAPDIIARYDSALRATLAVTSYADIKKRYIQDYAEHCEYMNETDHKTCKP